MFTHTGLIEGLIKKANKKGHAMSHIEQHTDCISAFCIDCGAEIVVALDENMRESHVTWNMATSKCKR